MNKYKSKLHELNTIIRLTNRLIFDGVSMIVYMPFINNERVFNHYRKHLFRSAAIYAKFSIEIKDDGLSKRCVDIRDSMLNALNDAA